ncbi:exosortase XrtG N-terminal extension domain-like protein [Lactobacillus kalixensis]|uniref:Lipoprotein n=1 Tax=Lactobacillus kalixensis DSM 16043 TaxID=1423763 RepID=A0A0R1U8V0_9LACO|nr:exosortase XrtG N-terminal extension domain-like protein [Lactobacillus kalixensis]KRL87576.1 hypothetical protein FC46_GL001725 [Lactobacillus kalixensis DSM 16043]
MRNFITHLFSFIFCLAFLFSCTETVNARDLPVTRFKNIEASFNTKDNKIDIFIRLKYKRDINMRLTAGSYEYTLKSNIQNKSFKKNKVSDIDLICVEKTNDGNREFILKDAGKVSKVNNSNYKYQIHYKVPLKRLNNNLDSSAIINFKLLRPSKKGHITTIGLSIPPWISILIPLVCVYFFSKIYFQRLEK